MPLINRLNSNFFRATRFTSERAPKCDNTYYKQIICDTVECVRDGESGYVFTEEQLKDVLKTLLIKGIAADYEIHDNIYVIRRIKDVCIN